MIDRYTLPDTFWDAKISPPEPEEEEQEQEQENEEDPNQ